MISDPGRALAWIVFLASLVTLAAHVYHDEYEATRFVAAMLLLSSLYLFLDQIDKRKGED